MVSPNKYEHVLAHLIVSQPQALKDLRDLSSGKEPDILQAPPELKLLKADFT